MRPRDPDDEDIRDEEAIEERKLLNKLVLSSFTANPATIQPFQASTLSWNVLVPATVSSQIDVSFTLGNLPVAAAGSHAVSPLATGAFVLTAHSPLTSRMMGTQVVAVELGECQEASLPRAAIRFQAQQVKNLFLAGSLSSRGDLDVQMLPPDSVRLKAPIKAAIPNFYDADIDIALDVRIGVKTLQGGVRVASVALRDVSVDVIFHLAEHIFSGGAATAAQGLIQPLAEDLIKAFLGPQIETVVARPLQEAINFFLDGWRGNDPQKRTFRLYSITSDPAGLIILGCPVPAPAEPDDSGPILDGGVVSGGRRRRRRGGG